MRRETRPDWVVRAAWGNGFVPGSCRGAQTVRNIDAALGSSAYTYTSREVAPFDAVFPWSTMKLSTG